MTVLVWSLVAGSLAAAGVYSLMQRSLMRIGVGLLLLSQSANLSVFICGGLTAERPPILSGEASDALVAAPLPQALVLTAIVIGFGLTSFALVLIHRARETADSDTVETFNRTDT